MSLNKVMVIGYLGHDPVLRHLPSSGQPVTGFSVATDESFKGKDGNRQDRVEWHNIVVFGRLAETCTKYLVQGRHVYRRRPAPDGRIREQERRREAPTHGNRGSAGSIPRSAA
jgi:single stranded DNA-binding protein